MATVLQAPARHVRHVLDVDLAAVEAAAAGLAPYVAADGSLTWSVQRVAQLGLAPPRKRHPFGSRIRVGV
jgi:hypothetical protein